MSSGSQEDIYTEHILDHYECPYHKGQLAGATCSHAAKNPLCGDRVELQLKIDPEGKIAEAYFDGNGCAISQAAASMLCEAIEGRPVDEVEKLDAREMLDMIGVPLTATRQKCGLLGFKVLKTMLYSLEGDSPKG